MKLNIRSFSALNYPSIGICNINKLLSTAILMGLVFFVQNTSLAQTHPKDELISYDADPFNLPDNLRVVDHKTANPDGSLKILNDPKFGWHHIETPIEQDPRLIQAISGGSIDVSYLGGDCYGFVEESPDFRFKFSGMTASLSIFFETHDINDDTTILINLPDGTWLCNDDYDESELDPMIMIINPPVGQYEVYIGSYDEGEYHSGTLFITESEMYPRMFNNDDSVIRSDGLDPDGFYPMEWTYLESGFMPDPFTVTRTAGGDVSVEDFNYGPDCLGYASTDPDLKIQWTGTTAHLRIYFEADDPEKDPVLMVHLPDGSWRCNDDADSETLQPMVSLSGVPEGLITIWIATYDFNESIDGILRITEQD